MRIGVPLVGATTMSWKSWLASMRPSVRSSSCPLPCSTAPPGISTFSATTASRTCEIDSPYEFSFSTSTTMWISRARVPAMVICPTPLTVWMARETCLSAISVRVRRLIASDDTISEITGSASGSTLVMTGGSSSGGTILIAAATFSRTSLAASFRLRSRTKRTVIVPPPSLMRADSSSMPETPLIASSIGSITDEEISSGLAPGSASVTLTVAGSARGNRSTPRSRKEKMPSTTSDITSIVAKTGRRTQISDSIDLLRARSRLGARRARSLVVAVARSVFLVTGDGHFHAFGEVVHIGKDDLLAQLHAVEDFHAVADPVAGLELVHAEVVAVDREHAVDAVAVLHRAIGDREHRFDQRRGHVHPCEGARFQESLTV